MEGVVKKFQGKFLKVREQLNRWDELQSCLISQFRSASNMIDRLKVLQNSSNYGCLSCNCDVRDAVVVNQMKYLDNIFVSMRSTLYLLKSSVISALSANALKPSSSDLVAIQQLLVDQPNLLIDEVQCAFDIIFAEL